MHKILLLSVLEGKHCGLKMSHIFTMDGKQCFRRKTWTCYRRPTR